MNEQDFAKLPTKTIFFRCAIPGFLAMIVSSVYVMIDGMFVGNLIGSHALAAVNLGFPIIMILFAVGDMIAVGSAVKIALALGEKDNLTANRIFSAAFYMMLTRYGCVVYGDWICHCTNVDQAFDKRYGFGTDEPGNISIFFCILCL